MMQIGSYIVPLVVVMIVGHGLSKGQIGRAHV